MADANNTIVLRLLIANQEALISVQNVDGELKITKQDADKLIAALNQQRDAVVGNKLAMQQFANQLLEVEGNQTEVVNGIKDFINYNQINEKQLQEINNVLKQQQSTLEVGSAAYKKHQTAIGAVNTAFTQLSLGQKETKANSYGLNMAMMQTGYALGDMQMIGSNFRMVLLGIGNNLPMIAQGFMQANVDAKSWGTTLGGLVKQQIMGPAGILIGINLGITAFQMLSNILSKNSSEMKQKAKEVEDLASKYEDLTKKLNTYNFANTEEAKKSIKEHAKLQAERLEQLKKDEEDEQNLVNKYYGRINTESNPQQAETATAQDKANYEAAKKRLQGIKDNIYNLTLEGGLSEVMTGNRADAMAWNVNKYLGGGNLEEFKETIKTNRANLKVMKGEIEAAQKENNWTAGGAMDLRAQQGLKAIADFERTTTLDTNRRILQSSIELNKSRQELRLDDLTDEKAKARAIAELNRDTKRKDIDASDELPIIKSDKRELADIDYQKEIKKIDRAEKEEKEKISLEIQKLDKDNAALKITDDWKSKKQLLENEYWLKEEIARIEHKTADEVKLIHAQKVEALNKLERERQKDAVKQNDELAKLYQDTNSSSNKGDEELIRENKQHEDNLKRIRNLQVQNTVTGYGLIVTANMHKNSLIEREENRHQTALKNLAIRSDQEVAKAKKNISDAAFGTAMGLFESQSIAYKTFAIAKIWIDAGMAKMAALAPPPVGLGPVLGPSLIPYIDVLAGINTAAVMLQDVKIKGFATGGIVVGEKGPEVIENMQDYASGRAELIKQTVFAVNNNLGGSNNSALLSKIDTLNSRIEMLARRPSVAYFNNREVRKIKKFMSYIDGKAA